MKITRSVALVVMSTLIAAWTGGTAGAGTATTRQWTPADQATIHPGVQTVTGSGQCTANFVFVDSENVYLGQAAHCSATGASTDVNGCEAGVLPLGTTVRVGGASSPGTIVYNSWVTMQEVGEKDQNLCLGNDFALVRLDPADVGKVNPSIPVWGGPNGLDSESSLLEAVYSYGNSSLRAGIEALSPKIGISTGEHNAGWSHDVYTVTPGIPGDSGSAYLGSQGGALGVLSTVGVDGSNQVSDVSRALAYMAAHSDIDAELANGTEDFRPVL